MHVVGTGVGPCLTSCSSLSKQLDVPSVPHTTWPLSICVSQQSVQCLTALPLNGQTCGCFVNRTVMSQSVDVWVWTSKSYNNPL